VKIKIDIIAFSFIIRGKRKAQQANKQQATSEHKRTQATSEQANTS
jgi:hypothetical protein